MTEECAKCGMPASISVCVLLSSIGSSPREQSCTRAVRFCKPCLQRLVRQERAAALRPLRQPLSDALTALTTRLAKQSKRRKRAASAIQDGTRSAGDELLPGSLDPRHDGQS
jgi:hypothetical protein